MDFRLAVPATIIAATLALGLQAGVVKAQSHETDEHRAAMRSIITDQIEAFRNGDGSAAYSLAAPRLQRVFPDVDAFMTMVERGYAPVIDPRSVIFGQARESSRGPVQEVFLVDAQGRSWTALYTFEIQEDGSYRITGCHLRRGGGLDA